ncbi:MAG: sulfatase-like hydrolase/transferase [Verrucomicrobiota bacterium]
MPKTTSRQRFLIYGIPFFALFAPCALAETTPTKPNIVIFISDDMGWNDVGYHGGEAETPNIDKLAAEGLELDRFYVHPICSPTRTAMMTGRLPSRFGITSPLGGARGVPVEEHFLSEAFKEAGYQTFVTGKWHLGAIGEHFHPLSRGFDHFYGCLEGMIDYYTHRFKDRRDWQRNGEPVDEEGYATDLFANEAVKLIKERDPAKPVFLYMPFTAPHGPVQAPEEIVDKYGRSRTSTYTAAIDAMDQAIGRVLETLDEEGMTNDTLVLFFCDNGSRNAQGIVPEKGLSLREGKGSLFEGGVRVPAVLRWPSVISPGGKSEQIISALDLFPTLTAAAGIEAGNEQPFDGVNVWPALKNLKVIPRKPVVIAGMGGQFAVIDDPLKLLTADGEAELYDVRADPVESKNLAETRPEEVTRLIAVLEPFKAASARDRSGKGQKQKQRDRGKGKGGAKGDRGAKGGKGERKKGRGQNTPDSEPISYRDLWIPPLLGGKEINLALGVSEKEFWPGTMTKTYGFNGEKFWGPTVVLNKRETVTLRVKNELEEDTTTHWHGLHLPPSEDGGPHQLIRPGAVWKASFLVNNNAATYWYHPHPHEATQDQITYGAGGFIIIRDEIESKLGLPRTYGVDDIPLMFTSRRFYPDLQFSFEGDDDKYGDYLLTNGTFKAQVDLPAQFVRLRILNNEIERGYDFGFSDNRTYYLIATDGGLVDKPIPLQRMKLMVGERVEILVDLSKDQPGSSLDLMAFNSGQEFGFPGAEPAQKGTNGSLLNNKDFPMLRINVREQTAKPVTTMPEVLTRNHFWTEADVDKRREIGISKVRGGTTFEFDRTPFDMHKVNHVVKLGDVEAWTIHNPVFGHAFHIHDVQFKIVSRSDGPVPPYEQGWKDTCYVPLGTSVTFITKFDKYASDTKPFMYHCHMANHEDEGLMGQFLVSEDPTKLNKDEDGLVDLARRLTPAMIQRVELQEQKRAPDFNALDHNGNFLSLSSLTTDKALVLYFIENACSCARDAVPFLEKIQEHLPDACNVVGVINGDSNTAHTWVERVAARFPLIPDPSCALAIEYDALAAGYTTIISPGGTIMRTIPGFNEESFREIASVIARATGVADRNIPFDGAPEELVVGCPILATPSL